MKALHKGSLFSEWSSLGWKEAGLSRMMLGWWEGWGRARGLAPLRKCGLPTFIRLCPCPLGLAEHQCPLHRSELLCDLIFVFGDFVGPLPHPCTERGLGMRIGLSSRGFSIFFSQRSDSAFAILLVCPKRALDIFLSLHT